MRLLKSYEYIIMALHGAFLVSTKLIIFYMLAHFSQDTNFLKDIATYIVISYAFIFATLPFFKNLFGSQTPKKDFFRFAVVGLFTTLAFIIGLKIVGLSVFYICLGLYLISLVGAFESITYDKYLASHFNVFKRPSAISLSSQIALISTFVITPSLGGVLYNIIDFQGFLWVSFSVYPLYILVSHLYIKDRRVRIEQKEQNNKVKISFLVIAKKYYPILYLYFLHFVWSGGLATIYLFFIKKSFALTQTGYLLSIGGVGLFLGNILFLWHTDRLHKKTFLFKVYSPLTLLTFFVLLNYQTSFLITACALFIGGISSAYCLGLAQLSSQEAVSSAEIGAFYLLRNTLSIMNMILLFIMVQYGCIDGPLTAAFKVFPNFARQDFFQLMLGTLLIILSLIGVYIIMDKNSSILSLFGQTADISGFKKKK